MSASIRQVTLHPGLAIVARITPGLHRIRKYQRLTWASHCRLVRVLANEHIFSVRELHATIQPSGTGDHYD